jgi:multiple sugar transport system permease protein
LTSVFAAGRRGWRAPGLAFIAPAAAALALMLVFPFTYTVAISLFDWTIGGNSTRWVGLGNYVAASHDARFLNSVINTAVYTVLSVTGEVVLGVAFALLLFRPFALRGVARALFMLPMAATPVAIALVWLLMFDPASGVLNYLLGIVGLPPSVWVNDARLAIPALALVDIWQWTPLVMLIVLGGLASLPVEPYEAAVIDGASRLQSFVYLTLPLLRPYIVVAALFRSIDALKTFDTIFVITGGGPAFASETLNLYIYRSAFDYLKMGYSSALLVIFFMIVLLVSLALVILRRRPA